MTATGNAIWQHYLILQEANGKGDLFLIDL
jgi:hypothetical protein